MLALPSTAFLSTRWTWTWSQLNAEHCGRFFNKLLERVRCTHTHTERPHSTRPHWIHQKCNTISIMFISKQKKKFSFHFQEESNCSCSYAMPLGYRSLEYPIPANRTHHTHTRHSRKMALQQDCTKMCAKQKEKRRKRNILSNIKWANNLYTYINRNAPAIHNDAE